VTTAGQTETTPRTPGPSSGTTGPATDRGTLRAAGGRDRPWRGYLAGWAAAAQLVLDLLLCGPYLALLGIGAAGVGLALAGGVGLILLALVVPAALGVAALERARLEAFTGVVVRPPVAPPGASWVRRVYGTAAAYKALLHTLLIALWGLVAGTVVLGGTGLALATAALPLYRSRLPGGQVALPLDAELPGWAVGWSALAGLAVLLLVVPLLSLLLVRVDVALVRGLLGAGEREQVTRLSQRVATLTETRERAVDSVELERRRIERDLHDGPQQRLVALAMDLGMARERLGRDPEGARVLLDKAHAAAKEAITEMRQVARGIHPPVLTDRGLDAALSALAARSPVPVSVDVHLPARPSPTTEAIAYFCVSEALTNVAKHARAGRASVRVLAEPQAAGSPALVVVVEDDGGGGARPGAGSGLVGLRDRVAAVDGSLWVESPPGRGTRVVVRLPWTPAAYRYRPPEPPAGSRPQPDRPDEPDQPGRPDRPDQPDQPEQRSSHEETSR
jgi:signal transduction histidine kinase